MTETEYQDGLTWLKIIIPTFQPEQAQIEAWWAELKNLSPAAWRGCLKLISREVPQWWDRNLVALVFERLPRVREKLYRLLQERAEATERKKWLEEREALSPGEVEENKQKITLLVASIGAKKGMTK